MTATTAIDFLQLPFPSRFLLFFSFFSFLFLFPVFAVLGFASSRRQSENRDAHGGGVARGSATDFCSCLFPWYRGCAISDELVKLAQSTVRLHVALVLCPSATDLCPRFRPHGTDVFSDHTASDRWRTANGTSFVRVSESLVRRLRYVRTIAIVTAILRASEISLEIFVDVASPVENRLSLPVLYLRTDRVISVG